MKYIRENVYPELKHNQAAEYRIDGIKDNSYWWTTARFARSIPSIVCKNQTHRFLFSSKFQSTEKTKQKKATSWQYIFPAFETQ